MNTENNPEKQLQKSSIGRRAFVKKAAGTMLVFGFGMKVASSYATTFTPAAQSEGRIITCFAPSSAGTSSRQSKQCIVRWLTGVNGAEAAAVLVAEAALDAVHTAIQAHDAAEPPPGPSWPTWSVKRTALEGQRVIAQADFDAALRAESFVVNCASDQGLAVGALPHDCTTIPDPTCLAWQTANYAAANPGWTGTAGNGPNGGSAGQCLW